MSKTPTRDEQGTPEGDSPRAASARLEVTQGVGDAAMLREAMDPANRSLADALQLSFRLLQVTILCLLVLFLFSGFKTVEANQSGVATLWGAIVDRDGLEPGLQMNWPPPVGEFVVFQAEGRTVDDGEAFVTRGVGVQGRDRAVKQAKATDRIKPERDGSFLTSDREIGHIASEARFEIVDPHKFLETVGDTEADELVRLALQRATVTIAARHTLHELRESLSSDAVREMLRERSQAMLDATKCGIQIVDVTLLDEPKPPLFLQKSFEDFSRVSQRVEADIEGARQAAQEQLIGVAGERHSDLERLINTYESELSEGRSGDETLAEIDAWLDGGEASGAVFRAISGAHRYKTEIEKTIGSEARRFQSLLPGWRQHPELIIAQRLLKARSEVLSSEDAELVYVPLALGSLRLDISGQQHVRDARRRTDLKRRQENTWDNRLGSALDVFRRVDELKGDAAGRQLVIDEDGRLRGMREDR
ncbi:MAG: SPFH domain-containing protein [Phycisphaerales bacterium]|nr:SPFH domain-containing protein [Phycisphaerales bacterium]HJN79709.1 SPFH domain-containing protein [Phycisphaerales bacterium]